jgi:hypothetical protein
LPVKKKAMASTEKKDSTAVMKDSLADPDPADTIAATSYAAFSTNLKTAEKVRKFLQTEFKDDIDKKAIDENSKKFIQYEFDINDDGKKEIFVGLTGSFFCGSGGVLSLF